MKTRTKIEKTLTNNQTRDQERERERDWKFLKQTNILQIQKEDNGR